MRDSSFAPPAPLPRKKTPPAASNKERRLFFVGLVALRLHACGLRDAGARSLHRALSPGRHDARAPRLERLDVGGNSLGPSSVRRLKRIAAARRVADASGAPKLRAGWPMWQQGDTTRAGKCRVEARGNCAGLEVACAALPRAGTKTVTSMAIPRGERVARVAFAPLR